MSLNVICLHLHSHLPSSLTILLIKCKKDIFPFYAVEINLSFLQRWKQHINEYSAMMGSNLFHLVRLLICASKIFITVFAALCSLLQKHIFHYMDSYLLTIKMQLDFILCLNSCSLNFKSYPVCFFLLCASWPMAIWRYKSKATSRNDYKLLLNLVSIHEIPAASHLLTSVRVKVEANMK